MDPPRQLRVLIVDHDRRVRRALGELLSVEPDLEVCGTVGTASAALANVSAGDPDVALIDLQLPEPADGLDLLLALHRLGLPAVVLTAAAALRERALKSGAAAFLEKDGELDHIPHALRSAGRQCDSHC